MRNPIRNLFKSDFVVNVSTLMSGAVISQIIPFLVAPVISRLYFPEDYAVVAAYDSITVLFTIVATGMYSSALMIDKTDKEAFNTAGAAFMATLTITAISILIFFIFNKSIARLTGNENITFWLYLIPLTIFFTGSYQTLSMWNNRLKRYKRLATNKILQTIVTSGATVGLGILSYRSSGLMISLLIGQMFAFGVLLYQTMNNDRALLKEINMKGILTSFKRHKDFPKYNMPQGFLDGFRESSIVFIISNYFGSVVVGSYSFAISMLNKPLQILGEAYRQVFFQKASTTYNENGNIWNFTKRSSIIITTVTLPFFLIILFWGSDIFTFLFGVNWTQAGIIAQLLSIWVFFKFISSPLSSIPVIYQKQKVFFVYGIINNISLPLTLLIGSMNFLDYKTAILCLVTAGVLNSLIQLYWFYAIAKKG
jgi:O-antigen/teichoic acid export membrane protein